jgi:hypothetical protein
MLSCGANRALPMPARCNQREFPINRCHQRVVTVPRRESLRRKRSGGRLRIPPPWPWMRTSSSLWKTLRSVALQWCAQNDANTGVLGISREVRGNGIWAGSQTHRSRWLAAAVAHPPWRSLPSA